MPESAYERARRHSVQKVLNQDTGKYEHRDENWVAPEGKEECPTCGAYHRPEDLQTETWISPQTRRRVTATYCPTCG